MKNQWAISILLGLCFGFLFSYADSFGEPYTSIAVFSFIPLAALASHDFRKKHGENIATEKVTILDGLGKFEWNDANQDKIKRGIIHLLYFMSGIVFYYLVIE